MRSTYIFTLVLRVDDPKALHGAALRHLTEVDGLPHAEAIELIGDADQPNIPDCVTACLDPGYLVGCSIDNGSTEQA